MYYARPERGKEYYAAHAGTIGNHDFIINMLLQCLYKGRHRNNCSTNIVQVRRQTNLVSVGPLNTAKPTSISDYTAFVCSKTQNKGKHFYIS